jgi:putative component of toxin-antitoxin plasmid stabilization module
MMQVFETDIFKRWLEDLRDAQAKARIVRASTD